MYLLDSSLFLELLLDQHKADEVEELFSLYSVGIILFRRKLFEVYAQFLDELIVKGGVQLLRLSLQDTGGLIDVAQKFNLDFDDAYQYTVAEKYRPEIISFDGDFDRTERGRKIPAQLEV